MTLRYELEHHLFVYNSARGADVADFTGLTSLREFDPSNSEGPHQP